MKPKSAMDLRIEKLIDVYCTYVFGVDRDAGWHAPSQLEGLKDACSKKRASFQRKQLSARVAPSEERQANDRADDKMINEVRYVRNKHYDFELANMLFSKLEEKQITALIAGAYLNYVYKKTHSEIEVAKYLSITKAVYRHNKVAALAKVEASLMFIDQYELAKSA